MQLAWVPFVAMLVASLLHIFWSYLLVIKYEMGVLGVAYAMTLTQALLFFSTLVMTHCIPRI